MIWWCFLRRIPLFGIWIICFFVNQVVFQTDKLVGKVLRIKERSPYILKGNCQQSGVCCQNIGIVLRYRIFSNSFFIFFLNLFYKYIYNFELIGRVQNHQNQDGGNNNTNNTKTEEKLKESKQGGVMLVYSCHNLSLDNSCGVYPFRPKLCREYPVMGLFRHDKVRKGCGFYFENKNDLNKFISVINEKKHQINKEKYKFSV